MTKISAKNLDFASLGQILRSIREDAEVTDCLGQRFIAAGMGPKRVEIHGVPGNALGAYLNGAEIEVFGNAQDAVGDTMNDGRIVIHGAVGDTAGYAMRGGKILVEKDAGYRAGIHMKEYEGKLPTLVIGGRAGSFLGEYLAGGRIVVLGLGGEGPIVGNFPCTGMHGGKVYLRSDCRDVIFPSQVHARPATEEDLSEIRDSLEEFAGLFHQDPSAILKHPFTVVTPDSKNPYRQMYVAN